MKPVPAIAILIAGAALAGWLLTLIPVPARAAGTEMPTLTEVALTLLFRFAEKALDWLRTI